MKFSNLQDLQRHIETNPKIMMGKPVIKGTRITVESILERLSNGEAVDDILTAHPQISRDAIFATLALAAKIIKAVTNFSNF